MKKLIKHLLVGLAVFTSVPAAEAAISPVAVAILPPVQFPPADFGVTGARFSTLWGRQRDMYGIDVGVLGNITDQDFVGLAVSGAFNLTRGQTTVIGLQAGGLANINIQKTNVYGFQMTGGVNYNEASSSVTGIQFALVANIAGHTDINGLQVGLYNKALTVRGLQIGLVNVTENLKGIQIGLMNFNRKGTFAVSPILNVGF